MIHAVYARQSVEKKDSVSIEAQIHSCTKYIEGEYRVYEDRGFSGKNTDRPAFQAMLQDIEKGRIQKVWVYRLDRFSRSVSDFSQIWARLEQRRVEFESISEKFDTSTPTGRLMLNIIMAFAQMERETTAERVRDNYYHRFSLGAWPGGPAPLGFDNLRITDPEGRRVASLAANAHKELVQRIYQSYPAPGASLGSIARELTAEGVPCGKRRGWDSVAVARILKNPVYVMADEEIYLYFVGQGIPVEQPAEAFRGRMGCHLAGKRNRSGREAGTPRLSLANHMGFIPSELWLACQEKLACNRQLDRTHVGKYSWLSGLLKCGKCGYAIKISRAGDAFYLHCSGHTNLNICDAAFQIDLKELEARVGDAIAELLAQCPEERPPAEPDSRSSEKLRQIETRIARLLAAYAQSTAITAGYLDREINKLERQRQELIRGEGQRESRQAVQRIDFPSLTAAEKKLVAARLIDRILLRETDADVIWAV